MFRCSFKASLPTKIIQILAQSQRPKDVYKRQRLSGDVYVKNKKVDIKDPADALKHGIGFLTEDRRCLLYTSGIEKKSDYIVGGSFKENAAYQACQRLMDLKEPPTAIFTSNNLITLGCLKFMKDKDMKIGRDISMVCFDEIHELSCTDINLTTVDRPVYEMGCAALELLEYSFQSLSLIHIYYWKRYDNYNGSRSRTVRIKCI